MKSERDETNARTLVNVGQDTALSDGYVTKEFVQFLIVADCELEMTGNNAGFLVVASCISGQFKDFGGKIFQHSGEVDGSAWQSLEQSTRWRK